MYNVLTYQNYLDWLGGVVIGDCIGSRDDESWGGGLVRAGKDA